MLKAIFLDYNGTTVMNGGNELQEAISRVIAGSTLKDISEFLPVWWEQIRAAEKRSNAGIFVPEEEITMTCLKYFVRNYSLHENLDELLVLVQAFWTNAPLFPDVAPFFAHCPWPVYIISNNGAKYICRRMETAGLKPAGYICGEMVQKYKPEPDLYRFALKSCRCKPEEVVHIGDSLTSDYQTAESVGIRAILLDRENKYGNTDCRRAQSLEQILSDLLETETYTVEEIIEPDFGCEGVPEGEKPRCRVILKDHNGIRLAATELDALLYERNIDEGSRVILSDEQGILPADI